MKEMSLECIQFFKEVETSIKEYCYNLENKIKLCDKSCDLEKIKDELNNIKPYVYNTNASIETLKEFTMIINSFVEMLGEDLNGSLNIKFGKNELLKKNYLKIKFIFTIN